MDTTVDRFGRIVIPKQVRDDLGIEPGTVLSIEERGDTVLLHLPDQEPCLVDQDGVLVFTGKSIGDIGNGIEISRKKRNQHFSKWSDKL